MMIHNVKDVEMKWWSTS